tara:strand:- start:277 stop:969 length:693 start_codon:yes stop_codon:yes gene_type:complete
MAGNIFDASMEDPYNPVLAEAARDARAAYRKELDRGSPTFVSRDPSDPVSLRPSGNETLASKLILDLGLSFDDLKKARSDNVFELSYTGDDLDVKLAEIAGERTVGMLNESHAMNWNHTFSQYQYTHNLREIGSYLVNQGDESLQILVVSPERHSNGTAPVVLIKYNAKGQNLSPPTPEERLDLGLRGGRDYRNDPPVRGRQASFRSERITDSPSRPPSRDTRPPGPSRY